jgi:hypothetical protein
MRVGRQQIIMALRPSSSGRCDVGRPIVAIGLVVLVSPEKLAGTWNAVEETTTVGMAGSTNRPSVPCSTWQRPGGTAPASGLLRTSSGRMICARTHATLGSFMSLIDTDVPSDLRHEFMTALRYASADGPGKTLRRTKRAIQARPYRKTQAYRRFGYLGRNLSSVFHGRLPAWNAARAT